MEIKWKNVFLALVIVFLLIHLPTIVNTVTFIVSSTAAVFDGAFAGNSNIDDSSQSFVLARFCVLLIFILGIVKLLKNWNR